MPPDESLRLQALRGYRLLDTPPEPELDDLVMLAAQICGTPLALLTLVDERRQWFKARLGMAVTETPREISFCGHAILGDGTFVVPDAAADERFVGNPLVTGEPHIRFYAGAPVTTADGFRLGTLCVIDRAPRVLLEGQLAALRALSRQAMAQYERRRLVEDARAWNDHGALASSRLAAIVESSDDAIIGKDLQGIVNSWNRGARRIFGFTAAEMEGQSILRLIPANRHAEEIHILELIARGESVRSFETLRKTKDGRTIEVSVTASPIRNAAGAIVGASKVARDVTEQKRTERRIRRLVDSNAQGVMFWNRQGEITSANDAFLRMVGYDRAELEAGSLNWAAMTPPEYLAADERARRELTARGACTAYEKEYLRKDGSRVPILLGAAGFEDAHEEGVCFVVDLTDRKKLEQQFLRAQRMESIGTLAGGIAHDLNNVLAPILMSLELLKDLAKNDESLDLIGILRTSAQRGADLIKQVLSFARGVEGQRVELDVRIVMKDLVKVMRETLPKTIEVRFVPPVSLWQVIGDFTQLHQVFMNLCVNARDAMPEGGVLNVGMRNLVLDETYSAMNLDARAGSYVVVQIADTGTGIPPEVREKIFEPFFTTKGIGKGTGLGLSTVLAIVKSHGGFIHVYSEPARGTKFDVYLPAAVSAQPTVQKEEAETSLPRGNGELILVVDDEAAVRLIVQRTLEQFGYRVLLANHGAEGVAHYARQQQQIAAVLTDIAMPIMDGASLIAALQEMNPAVRIIACSGLGTDRDLFKAEGPQRNRFIPKPYTAAALLEALRDLLHSDLDGR
jgi:PAS domain S-box-containing protein